MGGSKSGRFGKFGRLTAALLILALVAAAVIPVAAANESVNEHVKEGKKWAMGIKGMYKHERRMRGFVLNNDTLDEAKAFTLAGIDYAIASLESIKNRIEDSNLSAKEEIVAEIDSSIAKLTECKEVVESATTVEEFREAVKEVRETWRDARVSIEKAILIAATDRLESMLENGEKIEDFVEEKIAEFSDEGKDTTLLENWLDNFREDRMSALEKVQEAKDKIMEIETLKGAREAMKEIRDALRNAIQHTRDCMQDLRELIRLINEYGDEGDVQELMGVIEEVKST